MISITLSIPVVIDAVQVSNHCDWDGKLLETTLFKVTPSAGSNELPETCWGELLLIDPVLELL